MGSHSVKEFTNYVDLKFDIPRAKFVFNSWKTDSSACCFLIITQKLLGEMSRNFRVAYFKVLEPNFSISAFQYFSILLRLYEKEHYDTAIVYN